MEAIGVRVRIAPGADLTADPSTYSWQDVSQDWLASVVLRIRVGADDEDNEGDAEAGLTLRNGASKTTGAGAGIVGRYTQDNPFSDLWPLWTLSCPVEVAYDWGAGYVVAAVQYVSALTMIWPANSGRAPRVGIDLGGRLRQEQIGADVQSAMVMTTLSQAPAAFWPLEGAPDSALTGGASMTLVGAAQFGGTPVAAGGSAAANFSDGGSMVAPTGLAGAVVASWEAECVIGVDELPTSFPGSDIRRAVAWQTPTSAVNEIGVTVAYDGTDWGIGGFYSTSTRTNFFSSLGAQNVIAAGTTYHVRLHVEPWVTDPTKVLAQVWINDVFGGQVVAAVGAVTEPTAVEVNGALPWDIELGRPPANVSSLSQVALWTPARASVPDRALAMRAYVGEQAHVRIIRACGERRVPYDITATKSTPMGPQPADSWPRVIRDCESTDRGIIDDSRGVVGYRAGSQLYNLDPALTIDGAAWELGSSYAPTLDDQRARSDTTATSPTGARVRVDSGRTPRYTGSLRANVATTRQLRQAAAQRNHEGRLTTRYPSIGTALHANPHLIAAVMALRLGDIVALDNPPVGHAPGRRLLQLRGWTSELEGTRGPWRWSANATDGSLYEVTQIETGSGNRSRIPAGVSTLAAGYNATATSLSVTSGRVRWIDSATYSAMFPMQLVIAGEVVTCTAITGTGLTQTLTVTRGAPSKALPINSPVQLYRAPVIAR